MKTIISHSPLVLPPIITDHTTKNPSAPTLLKTHSTESPFYSNMATTSSPVSSPDEINNLLNYNENFGLISSRFDKQVLSSKRGLNCVNPIRIILESLSVKPNPDKPMISLSQGDPSLYNLFPIPESMKKAVTDSVQSGSYNSYLPSAGMETALKAISQQYESEGILIDPKSIFLTTGCTQALLWAIESLADKGDHILLPKPCFPLYKTFAQMNEIDFTCYDLLPDQDWEIDLDHLTSLITPKTKAILINNPSNPCGSVFSRQHIRDILKIASRCALPIIFDEVYAHFVFPGKSYHSLTSYSTNVPILICNSLSKRYIVPGWRIGWLAVYDPIGCMTQVRESINRFSQASFGVNSMIQAALPEILAKTPSSYFDKAVLYAFKNAEMIYSELLKVPGIKPIMPHGSMFMMVRIMLNDFPKFSDEFEIVEKLIQEQSVFPFPSSIVLSKKYLDGDKMYPANTLGDTKIFGIKGYLRISLILPHEKALEAAQRMSNFFNKHYNKSF